MQGVRATVRVNDASFCPPAALTDDGSVAVESVAWAGTEDGSERESFRLVGDERARERSVTDAETDFEELVVAEETGVYQFDRDRESPCACTTIEGLGLPVTDVNAREGRLEVTLFVESVDSLKRAIAALCERFDGVTLAQLVGAAEAGVDTDARDVDFGRLTDRQRTVLQTAFEMGYFAYPRESNADEVAAELGVSPSTFREHLNAAQSKLFDDLL